MKNFITVLVEIGMSIWDAIQRGETDKTLNEILPSEYLDRVRLSQLETQARADYPSA